MSTISKMNPLPNRQVEYALCCLVEIARRPGSAPAQAADLARYTGLPFPTVQMTLVRLRRHGLVGSNRGPRGGYVLARSAREITVYEVLQAFDLDSETEHQLPGPSGRAVREWSERTTHTVRRLLEREAVADLANRANELSEAMSFMPGL